MTIAIKKLLDRIPRTQARRLETRLLLHILLLVAGLAACLFPLLFFLGVLTSPKDEIASDLETYLSACERSISTQLSYVTAYGIRLSERITPAIERRLARARVTIRTATDRPDVIGELERAVVPALRTILLESRASGAFVVFDATVNSHLPTSESSRSGVYLKIANGQAGDIAEPAIFWLRGMPDVAERYRIEMHNMWSQEFNIDRLGPWKALLATGALPARSRYTFTRARYILDTWEKTILVCVPLVGPDGTSYGVCGIEINNLLFRKTHNFIPRPAEDMVALLAPHEEAAGGISTLDLGSGLTTGPTLTIYEQPVVCRAFREARYLRYDCGDRKYVGMERPVRITPVALNGDAKSGMLWVAAALLPEEKEKDAILASHARLAGLLLLFIGAGFLLAVSCTRYFSAPILRTMRAIREGRKEETRIQELDELVGYFRAKEKELEELQKNRIAITKGGKAAGTPDGLNMDISAYRHFVEELETLTPAEKRVFELYMQGFNQHEVAEKLFVSINTIRTHNRNIYGKLNVSSYKELRVYINMMAGSARKGGQET